MRIQPLSSGLAFSHVGDDDGVNKATSDSTLWFIRNVWNSRLQRNRYGAALGREVLVDAIVIRKAVQQGRINDLPSLNPPFLDIAFIQ